MKETKTILYSIQGILLLAILALMVYSLVQGFDTPWLVIAILLTGSLLNWWYTYRFLKRKDEQ